LLLDKKLAKELGENGRKRALKSYSFAGMLDKLETIYNEYSFIQKLLNSGVVSRTVCFRRRPA